MNNRDGFKCIVVKVIEKQGVPHQLFIKQHRLKTESIERPSDLTLFVGNVPPYFTEECLKLLFEDYGTVKSVFFACADIPSQIHENGRQLYSSDDVEVKGYKLGYVVFDSAKSLRTILSWKEGKVLSVPPGTSCSITCLKKWCLSYNASIPKPDELQKELDAYMVQYDEEENRKTKLAKSVTDSGEDGWISVSKRSRNPGFARKKSVKDNLLQKINRKKKKKTLLNLYSFQVKESKMNHLATLRKKFEEDKKKVEALKKQRKFKPF